MGLFNRRRLPAEVEASLRADGSGRVLAWAKTADGYAVAQPERLALSRGDGWLTLAWHTLLMASWDDAGTMLLWRTVARPHALETVAVTDPGRLPEVLRERVERTIVVRREVTLTPGVSATLLGRRPAEGDAPIVWTIVPPRGVDLRRPELAEAAAALIEGVKRDWA